MEPWARAALWQIWRCGTPTIDHGTLQKFSQMMGVPIGRIAESLARDGLVDVLPKVCQDSSRVTLLRVTLKGLDLVYEDETPRWKEALKQIQFERPSGPPERASLLKREDRTLAEVGAIMKLSRERVRTMILQHERQLTAYQERTAIRERFLNGETPFQDLNIEVLGPFNVRLANTLASAGIKTVPQLLATTGTRLLMVKNCGRRQIHEVNAKLEQCQTTPLEWGYLDLRYLRDP